MKTQWIKSSKRKPEYNVSVMVFIPEEDEHITAGMWDISNKWVLLDEYRVPLSDVTYWSEMIEKPKDKTYTPNYKNGRPRKYFCHYSQIFKKKITI